jgi:hypothetical protein
MRPMTDRAEKNSDFRNRNRKAREVIAKRKRNNGKQIFKIATMVKLD